MSLRSELATDLAHAIELYEQSFEWNGEDYDCVRRDTPTAMEMQEAGGSIEGVSYWLVVSKALFPDGFPQSGDAINEGADQIKRVAGHLDPAAVQLVLSIGSFDE